MKRYLSTTLLTAALTLTAADAKTISYTISGVTTSNVVAAGALTKEFPVGTKWSAVLEWDDSSTSLFQSDTQGQYRLGKFKVTLQGQTEAWTSSSLVDTAAFTLNLPWFGTKEEIQFTTGWGPASFSNPTIKNLQPYSVNIVLGDPTGNAIDTLTAAPSAISLKDWSPLAADSYFKFYLNNEGNQAIYGEIRSIQSNFAPEISVRQPSTNSLSDGKGERNFGTVKTTTATGVSKTFTIANTGKSKLTGLALSKSGSEKGDFILGKLPATSLLPGKSMKFTVTFKPQGKRDRQATLRIASNDANENPFDIRLTGTGE